jgi:signal transduction histidine kinase
MDNPIASIEDLREQLRLAQEALQRSSQFKLADKFCGSIMHEINNPLEAISNLVYLAKLEIHDADRVGCYLQQAEEQLDLVRAIARQTLSFYREHKAVQEIDLVALLEAALRIHTKQLLEKQIDIQRRLPKTLVVQGNFGELLEVISNLIVNSLESLTQHGTIYLRAGSTPDEVHITVADRGCGIPENLRKKLFQPFQSSKGEAGTGLGLWLTRNLVEKHHGRIRWRSSVHPGQSGTAFRITLRSSQEQPRNVPAFGAA